jgi:hypothetical protein
LFCGAAEAKAKKKGKSEKIWKWNIIFPSEELQTNKAIENGILNHVVQFSFVIFDHLSSKLLCFVL